MTHPNREPASGDSAIPHALLDFINQGSRFFVVGHKEPDGDCVGSQLALTSVLRRMGKEATPCSAGPFKRTEIKSYESLFTASPPHTKDGVRVIVVDCSIPDRTGDLETLLKDFPVAVIDHHTPNSAVKWPDECPVYVDAHAPSTTYLVLKLINALGMPPNREEAEFLFFGLCADTGFFRHVDAEGAKTFEAAAALIHAGANPKNTFAAIYGGKSLDSRKLLGHILLRAEPLFDGKLILSCEEYEETCRFGLEGRDSDNLYQLLQSVAGVQAIVIIRQETPDNCTVGLRSLDFVNVRDIAESLGGGGHKNAAGLSIKGTISEIRPKIIKAFENVF